MPFNIVFSSHKDVSRTGPSGGRLEKSALSYRTSASPEISSSSLVVIPRPRYGIAILE